MVYRKGMTAMMFIRFLKRLIRSSPRMVIRIVDNLRAHKAKAVQGWLEGREGEIEVACLPPCSPELNPDEYLDNTLKKQFGNRTPAATVAEQQRRVRGQMKSNQKRPELIMSLFQAAPVAYVA